ncbi:MAG: CoA transferase, partial [Alphaproteobacteria bacterium]|nr:CoA transferase [Alphaproteobacteria bacterium]
RDGKHVALSASMQAMAERLFRAMGQPELIDDPRFRTNSDRVAHKEELDAIVANFMASHDQKDLLDLFEREDVTVGPVVGIAEFVQHPYVHDRRVVLNMPDEDAGQIPMHHVVARMSDTPGGMIRQAPALGQDNDQIWRSIGEDPDYLRSKGVI